MTASLSTIGGSTALLGIFGDPVAHSLSPAMQNAALAAAGIDAVYLPLPVAAADLPAAVDALRVFAVVGVNVTIPHKEAVLGLLDVIDPAAQLIGAVNTIVNRCGLLTGYNTDAPGFLHSLLTDLGFDPRGKRIVLLGAGGACRAAVVALATAGAAEICIANRSLPRAEALVSDLSPHCTKTRLLPLLLITESLAEVLSRADLLVNTTAVGLKGESFPSGLLTSLAAAASVYDMVYALEPTPLLAAAAGQGRRVADGRGMLIAQGEAAFFHWFDRQPPAGVMRAHIM